MYTINVLNPETGEFETIATTHLAVQIVSDQWVEKTIFETDDPEYNG